MTGFEATTAALLSNFNLKYLLGYSCFLHGKHFLSLCFEPIQLQGHISLRLAIDHLTYLGTSMQPTESIVKRTTQPWSFLAAGDEASYLPNCQIWLLPFMQSVVFRNFIKTTSYLWTQYTSLSFPLSVASTFWNTKCRPR